MSTYLIIPDLMAPENAGHLHKVFMKAITQSGGSSIKDFLEEYGGINRSSPTDESGLHAPLFLFVVVDKVYKLSLSLSDLQKEELEKAGAIILNAPPEGYKVAMTFQPKIL